MFERDDWSLFRSLNTLSQKAGVPLVNLRRLVVKELVDNALDATGSVNFWKSGEHDYFVEDEGPGIPGSAEDIARLFSIRRPLSSTKIVRMPSRGALGNGLRVVVGAVLATGNMMTVTTRGVQYELRPRDEGFTGVLSQVPTSSKKGGTGGTRIHVCLNGCPEDSYDLYWAELAKGLHFAKTYKGQTSPWWYDSDSFYELLMAANGRPICEIIALFDGFALPTAVKFLGGHTSDPGVAASSFNREAADELLSGLREKTPPIKPKILGGIGKDQFNAYARQEGEIEVAPGRGLFKAQLPFVIEAWAFEREPGNKDTYSAFVNGTPVTGRVQIRRDKPSAVAIFGCGLSHLFEGVSRKPFELNVNVTIPYMPITTDGKEPDLSRLFNPLAEAIKKATRKLRSAQNRERGSQLDHITSRIQDGIRLASGDGVYPYSLRQLYYAIRPMVLDATEKGELDYTYFCSVITKYENEHGELQGMYRDPRGNLYHPHTGETIPLGTVAVEQYRRPEWTFNKVLYCEKEGLVNTLVTSGWPERNDCAILSSKGFASRAARDVIDLLGESDDELLFFCVHDADASGTLIYQALQEATPARAARSVKVINLGLEPWEALERSLQVENFTSKSKRPVAGYVKRRYDSPKDDSAEFSWEGWLQTRRVELNAMTSPEFIAWLDEKMAEHAGHRTKVVPPERVLKKTLRQETESRIRAAFTERILREAGLEDRVFAAMTNVTTPDNLEGSINATLVARPQYHWRKPLQSEAEALAELAMENVHGQK